MSYYPLLLNSVTVNTQEGPLFFRGPPNHDQNWTRSHGHYLLFYFFHKGLLHHGVFHPPLPIDKNLQYAGFLYLKDL